MAKDYNVELPGPHPPCEEYRCGNTRRLLRNRGPHIYECCGNDHKTHPDWLGGDHFREGGDRYGQLPPEDFDKKSKSRAKKFKLREHLLVALRAEDICFFCPTETYQPPKQGDRIKAWLQKFRRKVYGRLLERFKRNDGTDMAVVPDNWLEIIKATDRPFFDEINEELDFSKIQGDHLIPARLLELMSPDKETGVTADMLKYAGRELGVPTCEKCNRGRDLAGMESPEDIMEKWTAYYFDENPVAAKADPRYRVIELLAKVAYSIDQNLLRLRRQKFSDEEK